MSNQPYGYFAQTLFSSRIFFCISDQTENVMSSPKRSRRGGSTNRTKKSAAFTNAAVLRKKTLSSDLSKAEYDILGPISIPEDLLSGRVAFPGSEKELHPLEALAQREALPRVTAHLDEVLANPETNTESRTVWHGKVHELASSIQNDFDQGHFGQISAERAFEQAASRHVRPDGRPFSANPETNTESRTVWHGKVHELASSIQNDFDQGHFGQISAERAFEQAASRHVRPDGRPFSAKSLRQSLRQLNNKLQGNV
jgi:hypothetical protein